MANWLLTHAACLAHDTGPGHPENAQRLHAVLRALEAPGIPAHERIEAAAASEEQLARVHALDYVRATLSAVPGDGYRSLNPDTVISPASGTAALHAAGALVQAVDAVMTRRANRVFCAVRPPGHHAEYDEALGFCLFNNVAVAAMHAYAAHGLRRIAVVDFDVHHGNGTQHMLGGREGFLYASTHQAPLFPGTGSRNENRSGSVINVPLPAGTRSEIFREQFHNHIMTALLAFEPELILLSTGFDGHESDPLAGLALTEADFAWVTEELVSVADYTAQGRVISTLEGGYDITALETCTRAHIGALFEG